jgi:hypothetical protein
MKPNGSLALRIPIFGESGTIAPLADRRSEFWRPVRALARCKPQRDTLSTRLVDQNSGFVANLKRRQPRHAFLESGYGIGCMFRRLHVGILSAIGALISTVSSAQVPPTLFQISADSPVSARNANAPAELQQLAFLIGDWRSAVVLHRPTGDPYSAGAEMRIYNSQTGRWEGRNFYAGWKTWTESEGSFVDGEFVIETRLVDANGPFLSRERYFDIRPNSFRMAATRSRDGGQTWTAPVYEMVCTRIV